jgi:hypothetical protein
MRLPSQRQTRQTPACPSKSGGARAGKRGICFLDAPLRTMRQKLLQRAVDRGELGIELRAQPIYGCNDGKRNTGRNQAILDGRSGCFVFQKSGNEIHAGTVPLFCPNKPFWIKITCGLLSQRECDEYRQPATKILNIKVKIELQTDQVIIPMHCGSRHEPASD